MFPFLSMVLILNWFLFIYLHVLEKVVENPILAVQSIEGAAQSAIQYFENMRNFLEAVKDMQLLTFEASDLEKVLFFLNNLLCSLRNMHNTAI